jgi:thioredoxin reductase
VDETYDVLVVGGGAAGLSGALTLVRARRSVLVVDAGEPRNARAGHVHSYLARDGMPPAELIAAGCEEVTSYGGQIVAGHVETAVRHGDGFEARLHDGRRVQARRLLVTTGLVDELPDVPGVAERWGRDVLGCPYCHGREVRGRRIGVLATSPLAPDQASLWRQWSPRVMLLTHHTPAPGDGEGERLAARRITIVDGPVVALEVADDTLAGVRLASGDVVALDALVVFPRLAARAGVLQSLGLKPVDAVLNGHVIGGQIPADPAGATAVPGVWVAGNVADVRAHVIAAAAAGMNAAAAINTDLIAEETRDAVEAYRQDPAGALRIAGRCPRAEQNGMRKYRRVRSQVDFKPLREGVYAHLFGSGHSGALDQGCDGADDAGE